MEQQNLPVREVSVQELLEMTDLKYVEALAFVKRTPGHRSMGLNKLAPLNNLLAILKNTTVTFKVTEK